MGWGLVAGSGLCVACVGFQETPPGFPDIYEYSDANDRSPCKSASTCPVGFGVETTAKTTLDTTCVQCNDCDVNGLGGDAANGCGTDFPRGCCGSFSPVDNNYTPCEAHSECGPGWGKTKDGTSTADTVCTQCATPTFSDTTDKNACTPHTTCPKGKGLITPGTATVRKHV